MSLADWRSRLGEAYATQHADCGGDESAALVCWHDIRALLPPPAADPAAYFGCVRLLQIDGFDAEGICISPERAATARAAGVAWAFAAGIGHHARYVLGRRRMLSGPNAETL